MTARLISGKMSLVLTAALLAAVGTVAAQNKARVTEDDGRTAQLVASMVSSRHINHPAIDDQLSTKLLESFIKVWDPQKLYFLQSDIDEFNMQKTSLDDQILAGNVDFANTVFERFRLRMNERQDGIAKWIDANHDFTIDESMIRDPKELPWATTEAELDERWRKRVKYDLLLLKMDKSEDKEGEVKTPEEQLADARKRLHKRYHTNRIFLEQTEPHEILELYLSSMTHALDPHSSYMSPKTLDDFRETGRRAGQQRFWQAQGDERQTEIAT